MVLCDSGGRGGVPATGLFRGGWVYDMLAVDAADMVEKPPDRLDSGPASKDPVKKIIMVTFTFEQIKRFLKRIFRC